MLSCIFRVPLESVLRPFYEKAEHAGEDQMQVCEGEKTAHLKGCFKGFCKARLHGWGADKRALHRRRGSGHGWSPKRTR